MELGPLSSVLPRPPAPGVRALGDGNGAAGDVTTVAALEPTRAEAAAASSTSQDHQLDRAAARPAEDREIIRRLTAEDFAAIQDQLRLRLRSRDEDDGQAGASGDEVSVVDVGSGLEVAQSAGEEREPVALLGVPAEPRPDEPPPDFSKIVADAVVTIDEYLEWVNEAGGQPR